MAIAFSNLGATATPDFDGSVSATSYATASWAPPASGLIVLWVFANREAATPITPTVSGNSLTWIKIKEFDTGGTTKIILFAADATGSTTGATTVDFAGQTQRQCSAHFLEVTGSDVATGVFQTFAQSPTNSAGSGTGLSITLAAASNPANRVIVR